MVDVVAWAAAGATIGSPPVPTPHGQGQARHSGMAKSAHASWELWPWQVASHKFSLRGNQGWMADLG
jgi:hypothetical protein